MHVHTRPLLSPIVHAADKASFFVFSPARADTRMLIVVRWTVKDTGE